MYDVNGNGEIDKSEMFQIIQVGSMVLIYEIRDTQINRLLVLQSIYDLIGLSDKLNEQAKEHNIQNDSIEPPMVRTEQIFQKMDLDLNGVISENEFINGCLQDKFLYQMLTASNLETTGEQFL